MAMSGEVKKIIETIVLVVIVAALVPTLSGAITNLLNATGLAEAAVTGLTTAVLLALAFKVVMKIWE